MTAAPTARVWSGGIHDIFIQLGDGGEPIMRGVTGSQ